MVNEKKPFRILGTRTDRRGKKFVRYEAWFWEGPTEPGETGRYVRHEDEVGQIRFRNTVSPTCSFHGDLQRALA